MAYSNEQKALLQEDYSKIEEKRKQKLSFKQRKFLKHYLATGDGTEAAMRAYAVRNRSNAGHIATQLLKSLDFSLILEMAGASDSQLALKTTEGLNAMKSNKMGQQIPDLELRLKYITLAMEAKRKIKNKLEVTGENGEPIRFNILAGHGFIPAIPRSNEDITASTAGTIGGSSTI
jgi:hypothetical protein